VIQGKILRITICSIFLLTLLQVALMPLVVAQIDTRREDQLLKTALEYVEKNRKGTVQVRFIDEMTGNRISDSEVQYRQTSHDFMFGSFLIYDPDKARQLGLEWSGNVELSWAEMEPTLGVYDFSRTDDTIRWLKQNERAHIFARFSGLFLDWNYIRSPRPPAYADFDHIGDSAVFARYLQLVHEFAFNVASHYRGAISAYITQWEINWPGHAVFVSGLSERPAWTIQQAVELDDVVSKAIRSADPNATIMLGTSSPWKGPSEDDVDPFQFTELCLRAGVDVDAIAFEFYPSEGSPASFYDCVKKLGGLGKPVFIEETGYASMRPDADESWVKSWKWHVFDEHVQALWIKYTFAFAFGMREAAGISILSIRDNESTMPYHRWTDSFGLYTVNWQPKESAKMLRELMANFTTSGTARTDASGAVVIRGFAGNYTVHVSGYESVTVHVPEGITEDLTVSLVREKTSEYNDAAKAVESARLALSALRLRDLKTAEAENLTEAASAEYDLAVTSLERWELDAAQTHSACSQQLANQALQVETLYQQQQDYLKLSAVLATIGVIVAVMVVSLVRSRAAQRPRKEDALSS